MSAATRIGHEMISASAGSGKTHALTGRFIRLLALGHAPERIVALTFTRKAAGEFFEKILLRIAEAAADAKAARQLADDIALPKLGTAEFAQLLRTTVQSMHRLNLGTLDGFFARIVRSFPLELGLAGVPAVLDDHSALEETRRVLGLLFAAPDGLSPEQRDLIEAFKLATFGTEGKQVGGRIERFVAAYLALYRNAPEPTRWGDVRRIWPGGFPWPVGKDDPLAAATVLTEWANAAGLSPKHLERWTQFAAHAAAWDPGRTLSREIEYVLEKALESWADLSAGRGELKFDRAAQKLSPDAIAALASLVRRIVALELGRRLRVTEGIAKVLRSFDALYDAQVRRAGRLTFADIQQVLSPAGGASRLSAARSHGRSGDHPNKSNESDSADARLQLDYRLDTQIDHWLFDEFQDTSPQQWQILQNLVDEVVFDAGGQRSLFYVGDVKQAIYTWREGDPRLFGHVASRYASAPGGINARPLDESYRSGPAVIELVNTVCGDATAITELFPEAAPEWNANWRPHVSKRTSLGGQAALLFAADDDARWRTTLDLIREIEPVRRGLSCAVLVATNSTGAKVADYLRREGGIPAVAEADLHPGADNPVAAALASLLQAATHPGDTLAQQHVAMSPLAALLAADGVNTPTALTLTVRREIEEAGFEGWIARWARRLDAVLPADDSFSRLRLRQLVSAARAFDESGRRDPDAFLRYIEAYTVREPEGAGVVRVMTVHKSKGLGFDVVILPDLQGDKLAQRREGPAVSKAADRSVEWVLEFPGSLIAERDPVLGEYVKQAKAENCYEQMSLLYVALTRAKRGLYVVVEPIGKSKSLNFPRWLVETLGDSVNQIRVGAQSFDGAWSAGAADWFRAVQPKISADEAAAAVAANRETVPVLADGAVRPALAVRLPSEATARVVPAESLFTLEAEAAKEFGRAVHALFAEVEWCAPEEAASRAAAWRESRWPEAAVREVEACLRAPELRGVFASRGAGGEVWRERAFEAVVDGAWISGVFDRVVLERDPASGAIRRADIFDFKTDGGATEASLRERHGAQLRLYRAVAAQLTGLPVERVTISAIGTQMRIWVSV